MRRIAKNMFIFCVDVNQYINGTMFSVFRKKCWISLAKITSRRLFFRICFESCHSSMDKQIIAIIVLTLFSLLICP
jgi:hypothetical protein